MDFIYSSYSMSKEQTPYRKYLTRCLQAGYSLTEANSVAKKLADKEKAKARTKLRNEIETMLNT